MLNQRIDLSVKLCNWSLEREIEDGLRREIGDSEQKDFEAESAAKIIQF